jgi:hypothetical protein
VRYITTGALLLLAGCATATPIKTGNAKEYLIECNGLAQTWSSCFTKANNTCTNGYDTLEQSSENAGVLGGAQFKHLRIRCK